MQQIFQELNQLKTISGKNDKIDYIKTLSEDSLNVLKFLLNPLTVTGLSTKKLKKKTTTEPTFEFLNLFDLLNYLTHNNTGRDVDIANVQYFINQHPEYQEELDQLATKTYKLGVTAKSVNKALGSTIIPTFEVQLAHSFDKYRHKLKGDLFATLKFDGQRTIINTKTGKIYTRSGRLVEGLTEIEEDLAQLRHLGIILDGELLVQNPTTEKAEWFNETMSILASKGQKTNIKFIVFDLLSINQFTNQEETSGYKDRRDLLEYIFGNHTFKHIELAELKYQGQDLEMIERVYQEALNDGEEGLMVNQDEPYQFKRTPYLLKMKPDAEADVRIVGFEPGEPFSKYADTLGNILVDFNGTTVGIGSGLTDQLRDEIWNNQDSYLGKLATVKYTSLSKNKNDDSINLRFPRFKAIRDDKTEVNIEEL